MMEQQADVTLIEERRAALYRIAARCAQAMLVVERKARRAEYGGRRRWSREWRPESMRESVN